MILKTKLKQQTPKTEEELESSGSSAEMEVDDSEEIVEEDSDEETDVNSESEENINSDEEENSEEVDKEEGSDNEEEEVSNDEDVQEDTESESKEEEKSNSESKVEVGKDEQPLPSKVDNSNLEQDEINTVLVVFFGYVIPNSDEDLEKIVKDLCNRVTKVCRTPAKRKRVCFAYFKNREECSKGLEELTLAKNNGKILHVRHLKDNISKDIETYRKSFTKVIVRFVPPAAKISVFKEFFPKAESVLMFSGKETEAKIIFANYQDAIEACEKKYQIEGKSLQVFIEKRKQYVSGNQQVIQLKKIIKPDYVNKQYKSPFDRNEPFFQKRQHFHDQNAGHFSSSTPYTLKAFKNSPTGVNENKTIAKAEKRVDNERENIGQRRGNVHLPDKKKLKRKTEATSDKEVKKVKLSKEVKKIKTRKDKEEKPIKKGKVTKVKEVKEEKISKVKKIKKGVQIEKAAGKKVSVKKLGVKVK